MKNIGAEAAKLAGLQIDTLQKVRRGQITPEHWEWFNNLSKKKRDEFCGLNPVDSNPYLTLLSADEHLTLDAVDGAKTIAKAKDTFAWIDSDFINYKADEAGPATEETPVNVYELTKDAAFAQMFNAASTDLNKLCFTKHQILNFIKKYKNWLRTNGYATFFLFKANNYFFVACVLVHGVGLHVYVDRLENGNVWDAEDRHRLVLPQLAV